MTRFFSELRQAARVLRKSPGFTLTAVLVLGLGIGANTAIFSVTSAVLLRPLPYADANRIVILWEKRAQDGTRQNAVPPADYLDWIHRSRSFEALTAHDQFPILLKGNGPAERLIATLATSSMTAAYGVPPILGRAFRPEDETGDAHVTLLAWHTWRQRFGGDPNVVGRVIRLDDTPYKIVGVMPPPFRMYIGQTTDLYLPLVLTDEQRRDRTGHSLLVLGRLRPNVSLEQAQAEMDSIGAALAAEHPENLGHAANLVLLHDQLLSDIRPILLLLSAVVTLVLLIACANVANLLLARATGRRREMEIRQALGASRLQLLRRLLAESLLISIAAAAAGLGLAAGAIRMLAFLPERFALNIPGLDHVALDRRVLGFTLGVAILCALVFGLLPAPSGGVGLSSRSNTATRGGRRLLRAFIVSEVALACALLIGATLLIETMTRLLRVDPGFQIANRLSLELTPPDARYPDLQRRLALYRELTRRIRSLPGVRDVAVTSLIPGNTWGPRFGLRREGQPPPRSMKDWTLASWRVVSDNYFATMGIPILRGRAFHSDDRSDSPKVVLLSQATVRRYWGDRDPIGARVAIGFEKEWRTVAGVTGSVRYLGLNKEPEPEFYIPLTQFQIDSPGLVVLTSRDPETLANGVRREIAAVDPDVAVSHARSIQHLIADSVAPQRLNAFVTGAFAAAAFLLAAAGLFSSVSYIVAQRTREMSIRIAVGAGRRDILKMLLLEGGALGVWGVALGTAGALVLTRLLRTFLFGVSASDPAVYAAVGVLLLGIAVAASVQPAWRATSVDPMDSLRAE